MSQGSSSKYENMPIGELRKMLAECNKNLDFEESQLIHDIIDKKSQVNAYQIIADQNAYIDEQFASIFSDFQEFREDLSNEYAIQEHNIRTNFDLSFQLLTDSQLSSLVSVERDKQLSITREQQRFHEKAQSLCNLALKYAECHEYEKAIQAREESQKTLNEISQTAANSIQKRVELREKKLFETFQKEIRNMEQSLEQALYTIKAQHEKELKQQIHQVENMLNKHIQIVVSRIVSQVPKKTDQAIIITEVTNYAKKKSLANDIDLGVSN